MSNNSFFFIILVIIGSSNCKSQKNAQFNTSLSDYGMELVLEDNYGGSNLEETFFIKDQKSLEAFYGKINRTRKPGFPLPKINFNEEMLFVWNAGKVHLEKLTLEPLKITKDTMVISVNREKSKYALTAIVQPFKIYRMPISNRKIILQ